MRIILIISYPFRIAAAVALICLMLSYWGLQKVKVIESKDEYYPF